MVEDLSSHTLLMALPHCRYAKKKITVQKKKITVYLRSSLLGSTCHLRYSVAIYGLEENTITTLQKCKCLLRQLGGYLIFKCRNAEVRPQLCTDNSLQKQTVQFSPAVTKCCHDITILSILTVGCVRVCVCVCVRTLVTETEAACARSRMYFDL